MSIDRSLQLGPKPMYASMCGRPKKPLVRRAHSSNSLLVTAPYAWVMLDCLGALPY